MTQRFDEQDSDFYQAVIEQLITDFPWIPMDSVTAKEAADRASEGAPSVGEIQLTHLHTDAYIYISLPDYRGGNAARLILYHPLDQELPTTDEGFISSLGEAHRAIASVYQSDYTSPVADPTVILHGSIPVEYTEEKLYSMMTAMTAIVLRIQRLHEDIQSPVADVLSNNHSPPGGTPNSNRPLTTEE